jgi:predicted PurR-regulated permease PerM
MKTADGLASRAFLATVVAVPTAGLLVAAWIGRTVLLLVFASWLLSLVLAGGARVLQSRTSLKRGPAVLVAALVVLLVLGGLGTLIAADLADQVRHVAERLPQALARLQARVASWGIPVAPPHSRAMAQRAAGVASSLVGAGGGLAFVLFVGLFFALEPEPYRKGLLWFLPAAQRERAETIADRVAASVERWMVARVFTMVVVAVATGAGLAALGIPSPLALGLIAGLLDFVPNVGPLLAAAPALALATEQGTTKLLLVAALYIAVQTVESYVIAPLAEEKAVRLPVSLIIVVQALLGFVVGPLGLVFATPLLAAVVVMLRGIWPDGPRGKSKAEAA